MKTDYKYRAFLSYSHKDRKYAKRLHRELERFRIPKHLGRNADSESEPKKNLRPIFRDRDELSSGSALSQVITGALGDSECLIVICSPSAVASNWVSAEIRTFQRQGRHDRIFCYIVDGTPMSGDEEECFPEALRNPIDTDGQLIPEPDEPIAADASDDKKNWQRAKLMLIAGILGVGLDELLQRDLQRRNRTMFAVAATSVSIAVVMLALTAYALLSQAKAERRKADADNLVSFLLGDLQQELHAVGRTDLYSSVAEKAMEYFKSLEGEDARDEVLAQRAEALRKIGSAHLERSDMKGAENAFNESLTISRRLAEQNPDRLDWSLALAESHFYVGRVHWQRGELQAARTEFQNQLSVVDKLAAAQPDNTERLEHSGFAWTNYGRVLELSGQYNEGLHAYKTVMDVFQRVLNKQPNDTYSKLEVGFAHNNLGKLKTSLGLLEEAEAHYRSDLQIKKEAAERDLSNNEWRSYLASSHFWLGKLLLMRGELDDARHQNESALVSLDALLINDPNAMGARKRRAEVYSEMAANCRLRGETGCASSYIESALADLEILTNANPENAIWLKIQADAELEAAWQAEIGGDHGSAVDYAEKAHMITEQLTEQAPFDRDVRKLEITTLLTLGDLSQKSGQAESARFHWISALDTLNQNFITTKDPRVLDLQIKLLNRNGYTTEVKNIEQKLAKTAYLSPYPWP